MATTFDDPSEDCEAVLFQMEKPYDATHEHSERIIFQTPQGTSPALSMALCDGNRILLGVINLDLPLWPGVGFKITPDLADKLGADLTRLAALARADTIGPVQGQG